MGKISEIDYILNECVHIDKTKYKKQLKKELIMSFIMLITAIIVTILTVMTVININKLKQENIELKQKIQEYQNKIVYYRHTYEDEV